ncbi:hypothetical protein FALBO_12073 [Fusarium albosuccineum]|uniref:SnoaL-like domain-containing protein n=1 Tax=Fusarium albosuccineum TaxID=1237068 RepID=A0A8H4L415_9HYPO|nr:hypothetical protein FALBO_12073 [Fusarium albosuccineum]
MFLARRALVLFRRPQSNTFRIIATSPPRIDNRRSFHVSRVVFAMSSVDQTGSEPSFKSIGITNTDIHKAPGVQLTPHQEVLVGSILDLFEGHPSLRHLSLWAPTATFQDPITTAVGHDKFAAQWYGLTALFSPITIQSHEVTSTGNPLSLKLSNKYVLKGLKTEKVMDSVVDIHVGPDGKIERVEDKWNGTLPQGAIATAFQKLNAVTVPAFVKVPKTQEEDDQMRADRAREAQTGS